MPSPRALWQFAAELAATLGAACPPLSPALWLQRYLAELQLPAQLLPVALQLHQLYQPTPLLPAWTRARSTRHPWARLMAALVVAGERRSTAGPLPGWAFATGSGRSGSLGFTPSVYTMTCLVYHLDVVACPPPRPPQQPAC